MRAIPVPRKEIFPDYSRIYNLEYPDEMKSPEMVESEFNYSLEGAFEENYLYETNDGIVGACSIWDQEGKTAVEKLDTDIVCEPSLSDNHLIDIIQHGIEVAERVGCNLTKTWTSDRFPRRIELYESVGYRQIQDVPVSRLTLADFDPTPFDSYTKNIEQLGLKVETIEELIARGVDWKPMLHESAWEMSCDIPNAHPPTPMPFEQYSRLLEDRNLYSYDLMFAIVEGDRIVAYSRLTPTALNPGLVMTGLSGVVRTHRRQGLVTAIKVAGLLKLRSRGYTVVQTDNDITNPMYQLNLRLGFKPHLRFVQLEKKLKAD